MKSATTKTWTNMALDVVKMAVNDDDQQDILQNQAT